MDHSLLKFNKTKAKNKLDALFSLQIRSAGKCFLRGKDHVHCNAVLQCAHIIGRGKLFLRWHPKNALCLCSGHHVWYTNNPESWRNIMLKLCKVRYTWLLRNKNKKIKFNEEYYQKTLKRLGVPAEVRTSVR